VINNKTEDKQTLKIAGFALDSHKMVSFTVLSESGLCFAQSVAYRCDEHNASCIVKGLLRNGCHGDYDFQNDAGVPTF
jgi:hypothetical protein